MNKRHQVQPPGEGNDAQIVQVKAPIRTQHGRAPWVKASHARYTDIFSSLLLTEKLFSADPGARSSF